MPKKVIEEETILTENQKQLLSKIDFSDTFSTTNHTNSIQEIAKLIFGTVPGWIEFLFVIRNGIMSLFGLKAEMPSDYNDDYKVGGYILFFKIFSISPDELVLGLDDNHLNFRAIVENQKSDLYNIKVITLVEYNNLMGKIYMGIIKPFHKLVVKRMVRNGFQMR